MRLLFLVLSTVFCQETMAVPCASKILLVRIGETGDISVNGSTVGSDDLSRYIQERLFKSYAGTGAMHDRIVIEKENQNVPDMVTQVVIEEIQAGQTKALTELSLEKYGKRFENLDPKKQDKLRKQFPVLFQTEYK
jgi:hypothetical protein